MLSKLLSALCVVMLCIIVGAHPESTGPTELPTITATSTFTAVLHAESGGRQVGLHSPAPGSGGSSSDSGQDKSDDIGAGDIAGAVVGGITGLTSLFLIVGCLFKRYRKPKDTVFSATQPQIASTSAGPVSSAQHQQMAQHNNELSPVPFETQQNVFPKQYQNGTNQQSPDHPLPQTEVYSINNPSAPTATAGPPPNEANTTTSAPIGAMPSAYEFAQASEDNAAKPIIPKRRPVPGVPSG